ncbi:MAG: YciI family protein [Acidimicrobiia bacterium]
MTQYLLAVYDDPSQEQPSADEMKQIFADVDAVNGEFQQAGVWVFAGGLHPSDTATTVRVEDDETLITDGPFAETKEQIGGFWIIEVDDLDAALEWAGKAARACRNPVEVRPFQDEPEA